MKPLPSSYQSTLIAAALTLGCLGASVPAEAHDHADRDGGWHDRGWHDHGGHDRDGRDWRDRERGYRGWAPRYAGYPPPWRVTYADPAWVPAYPGVVYAPAPVAYPAPGVSLMIRVPF